MDLVDFLFRKIIEEGEGIERGENELFVIDLVRCPKKLKNELSYPYLKEPPRPWLVKGVLIHRGLSHYLELYAEEKNVKVEIEKDISKTFNVKGKDIKVRGRVDAVVDGVPVEIKSVEGKIVPNGHHIEQLSIYMNMLGAREGILLYVTPARICDYRVSTPMPDEEIKRRIEEALGIIPAKVPRYEWECDLCWYNTVCNRMPENVSL